MEDFSEDNAFEFLKNIFHIEDPSQTCSQMNKLDFLNVIIRSWHEYLPFQNVTQLQLTKRENRLPTVQEIIHDQMAGKGGVCLYQAVFCQVLLEALGYSTRLVVGSVYSTYDHVMVVVHNVVTTGDMYLVEVGCAFVTVEAVPLDFDTNKEHVYFGGGLEYKYSKLNNVITRFHARGDDKKRPVQNVTGKWRRYYDFDLNFRSLDFVYSDEASIKAVLLVIMPSRWLLTSTRAIIFRDNKTIAVKHKVLIIRSEHEDTETPLENEEELFQAYEKYFPVLDRTSVMEAIQYSEANAETLK